MKYKKIMFMLVLAVFLLSITCVSASEIDDTLASEDTNTIGLSVDNDIIEDNLQTSEENDELALTDNDETLSAKNDTDVLSDNTGTYSGLSAEIGSGGNIELQHDYYAYDTGNTISISVADSVIDGKGAIINMTGSNIRAFYVSASGVTIKNLTIINATYYGGSGGAIYFSSSGTVSNCNFTGNTASNGGAVYFSSTGEVTNCNFTNSTASRGGAVYFLTTGTVSNCNFNGNTGRFGNAIYINNHCTISDCDFASNPITKGAIHSIAGCVTLSNNILNFDDVVEGRNFTEIQKLIDTANEGDEITIDGLYTGFGIPIRITKSLTLIGQNNATLDAKKLSKILYITANNVIIKNIQFTNGYAESGGAVYFNSNGSVTNCTFIDNTGNDGGAVYFAKDTIGNVINCNFTGNTARYGGAVLFESNSNVTNCTFTGNTATYDGGAVFFNVDGSVTNCTFTGNTATHDGGAVYFYNAGLTNCNSTGIVTNCTFTGNTATHDGGAVYFYNAGLTNCNSTGIVTNCTFTGNTIKGSGGAVFFSSEGIVSNCNFVDNKATGDYSYGGAIRFIDSGTVSNCNFAGNTASRDGGAIYFLDQGTVTNCNFTGNTARYGGAVFFNSNGEVTNCNFVDNKATGSGGAVYIGGNGNVTNCNFINNEANGYEYSGGAVYIGGNGNVTNCNFTGNTAEDYGGAVSIGTGNVTNCNFIGNNGSFGGAVGIGAGNVSNCNFIGNNGSFGGGAVYFWNPGTVTNCDFTGNTARYGGAVYFSSTGEVTNCNFTGNTATDSHGRGGAIFRGHVVNCNFVDNKATGDYSRGGAISTSGNVTYCNFTNNSASHGGAVLLAWSGVFNATDENFIANCNFVNNFAFSNGGAVSFDSASAWGIKNCNLTNNSASFGGGAIECHDTGIIFEDCNFANNRAQYGGVIYVYFSHLFDKNIFIINCTFMDNIANHGSAIHLREGDASDVVLNIFNSTFLNNRADAVDLQVYLNGSNVEIIFTGQNYLLNAIDSINEFTANLYNVTYWGANGITNTDISTPVKSNRSAGQNVTVFIVNGEHIESGVYVTDENGTIVLENVNLEGSYFISARHDTDSYYTEIERIISENMKYVVNVTSQTTKNKTVNITAKSNIYSEGMPGKLLFILPDGTEINATYGANGIWWAMHTFDLGVYQVTASYVGLDNVTLSNGTIAVTAPEHTFWFLNYTINGNDNPVIELSNDFYFDPIYDAAFVNGVVINRPVTINGNGIVIDAKGQGRIFDVQSADTVIENLTLKNANYNSGNGGAIYFASSGTVSNCNFTNNIAYEGGAVYFTGAGIVSNCTFTGNTARWYGGALRFRYSSTVSNCTFTGNTAAGSGGAIYSSSGTLTNCNFTGNTATGSGGAIMFVSSTTVSNCNFNDNSASSGGAVWMSYGGVSNSNFTGNNATTGSAIYFASASTLSNSILLNNRADAEALDVVKNDNNITITFTGQNNLLNAIYSDGDVTFTNVTYWGADGIATVSATMSGSNKAAGQNITVGVFVNGVLVLNDVYVTDADGRIVLNINAGDNYYIIARHDTDSYYTEAERTISNNTKFNVNVTSQTNTNKTVNITAKSNIYSEVMPGKLLFILPNGIQINANYAGNGTWWALYTFDDYGEYNVSASYLESGNVTVSNGTITITRTDSAITLDKTVFDYGDSINVATVGAVGITAEIDGNNVTVVDFIIPLSGVNAGTYNLTVTTMPDDDHNSVNKTVIITVNKVDSTLTVDDIAFDYNGYGFTNVSFTGAYGVNASVVGYADAVVEVNDDNITVSGLNAGTYNLTVTAIADGNHNDVTKNVTITVNKLKTQLTANAVTATYNVDKYLVITLKDSAGKVLSGVRIYVDLNGVKTYTTDKNGQIKVSTKGLAPKAYAAKITFNGNANYVKSTKNVKVTVKKATPKLTAKKKTFKKSVKSKKYSITLKTNTNKAMKKVKVTLKVNKKTYTAKTNSKGKATFKIKKLTKKGTYKATVTFKGNKYYNKVVKKVKIKIK